MQDLTGNQGQVRTYGPQVTLCRATFVPQNINTNQVLLDNMGIKSIIRTDSGTAGRWTVTLAEKFAAFDVVLDLIENDTTHYHWLRVDSKDLNAGTFIIAHRSVAVASVASGAALNDTVDGLTVIVFGRAAM